MHRLLSSFLLVWMFIFALAYAEKAQSERGAGNSSVQGAQSPAIAMPEIVPMVNVDSNRGLGNAGAKIAVVEFGDYQCPYCRSFHVSTFPKLNEAYIKTGKIRYFYKDFPLSNHSQAFGASVAAHCAGAQGRYWEMHDLLYTEQARLSMELYNELAAELKLDMDRFKKCSASSPPRRVINRDIAEGRRMHISGTPNFVIGRITADGIVVERTSAGAPLFDVFARELDALLLK